MVPDTPDGYVFTVGEKATTALGDMSKDPALNALRDAAKAEGWTQGQFNERVGKVVDILAEKGFLVPSFDPAAELATLSEGGKDGKARQQEVQVFADSLKARGDIDEQEYAELVSLQPTAAGVRLIEKLRAMSATGGLQLGGGDTTKDQLRERAAEMRRDARYDTDGKFRREADAAYMAAYS